MPRNTNKNSHSYITSTLLQIPYKRALMEFPVEFQISHIYFESFINGKLKLTFKKLLSNNVVSLLRKIPGFKLFNNENIEFSFNFKDEHDLKPVFYKIFSVLKLIYVGNDICDQFVALLGEYQEDYCRDYPDKRPFTEVEYYSYEDISNRYPYSYRQYLWNFSRNSMLAFIEFDSCINGQAILAIKIRNNLSYPFLEEALSDIDWPYGKIYGEGISFCFDLNTRKPSDIYLTFKKIFNALEQVETFFVNKPVRRYFFIRLIRHFQDFRAGFKPLPISERKFYLVQKSLPDHLCKHPLPLSKQMFVAAESGDFNKLLRLLREGISANTRRGDRSVAHRIISNPRGKIENCQTCMKALIEYGMNLNYEVGGQLYEEQLLNLINIDDMRDNPIRHSGGFYMELLTMIKLANKEQFNIVVHEKYKNTDVVKIIQEIGELKQQEVAQKATVCRITPSILHKATIFTMTNNEVLKVKVKKISIRKQKYESLAESIEPEEYIQLLNIFRKAFPHAPNADFETILKEALIVRYGTLYLDLVYNKEGRIIAFNIAEVVNRNPDGSLIWIKGHPSIIHHLRLSVSLSSDVRFMPYLMHARSCLLHRREQDQPIEKRMQVVSIWDAVTFYSLMQKGVYYPKYDSLKDLALAADKAVYNMKTFQDPESGLHYYDDQGLAVKPEGRMSFVDELRKCYIEKKGFSDLLRKSSKELFQDYFLREGSGSILTALLLDDDETRTYLAKTMPLLDDAMDANEETTENASFILRHHF